MPWFFDRSLRCPSRWSPSAGSKANRRDGHGGRVDLENLDPPQNKMDNTICYLNTDLDVISADDLRGMAAVFELAGVTALHVTNCDDGLWRAIFETQQQHSEPEQKTYQEWFRPSNRLRIRRETCGLVALCPNLTSGTTVERNPGVQSGFVERIVGPDIGCWRALRVTLYPDR